MKKILALSLFAIAFLSACGEAQDGRYAQVAQCLTDKGVKFYGAFWCPNCADQKELFGADIRYITYVECDPRGENADPQACRDAGVTRYPTWTFPGQDNVIGTTAPEILGNKANCEITEEDATGESPAADNDDTAVPVEDPAEAVGEENPAS